MSRFHKTIWSDGPQLRSPVFYHNKVYGFRVRRGKVSIFSFKLDDKGVPGEPEGPHTELGLTTTYDYLASCVFQGRVYLFTAGRDDQWKYEVQVCSATRLDGNENDWTAAQGTGLHAEIVDWWGKFPVALCAATLGERIYVFFWRSENKREEAIWFSSSADGSAWDEPTRLTKEPYNPFFCVAHCLWGGDREPRLAVVGTRHEDRKRKEWRISWVRSSGRVEADAETAERTEAGWDNPLCAVEGTVLQGRQTNTLQIFWSVPKTVGSRLWKVEHPLEPGRQIDPPPCPEDTGIENRGTANRHFSDVVAAAMKVGPDQRNLRHYLVVLTSHMGRRREIHVCSWASDEFIWKNPNGESVRPSNTTFWTLLGVFEGVLPFMDLGGGVPSSTVVYGRSTTEGVSFTQETELAVNVKVGKPSLGADWTTGLGWSLKSTFAAAVGYGESTTSTINHKLMNKGGNEKGTLGFLLYSRPLLSGRTYERQSADGRVVLGEYYVMVTERADQIIEAYKLANPTESDENLEGLRRRPPSSKPWCWNEKPPSYPDDLGIERIELPMVGLGPGHQTDVNLRLERVEERSTRTSVQTTLSASIAKTLFGVDASISYRHQSTVKLSYNRYLSARLEHHKRAVDKVIEVVPVWYLPKEGAHLEPDDPELHWVPEVHAKRGLIPFCLSWQVLKPTEPPPDPP